MVCFAYGWPKTYGLPEGKLSSTVQAIIVDPAGKLMITIVDTGLYVWAARLHRVLIGQYLVEDGEALVGGCFGPAGDKVAAADRSGKVTILEVKEQPLLDGRKSMLDFVSIRGRGIESEGLINPEAVLPVTMRVVGEVRVAHAGKLTCVGGCSAGALVGTSKGDFTCVAWDGEVLWRIHVPELLRTKNAISKMGVVTSETAGVRVESNVADILAGKEDDSSGGVVAVKYDEKLDLCGIVMGSGVAFLLDLGKGGAGSPNAVDGRWLRSSKAVSIDIEPTRMLATVGLSDGDVEQFYIGVPAGDSCPVIRTLSLSGWYFEPADVGGAKIVSWSPDRSALAVGWEKRGLAVWSVSGCRLMWTLPQVGGTLPTTPALRRDARMMKLAHPMEQGAAASAWSPHGCFLWASARKTAGSPYSVHSGHFTEFSFYKTGISNSGCQNEATRLALFGSDRVLLLTHSDSVDVKAPLPMQPSTRRFDWKHLLIPHDYLWKNFPVQRIAVNDLSSHVAVAGVYGVGICHIRSQRWRFFGDLVHDRRILCCVLAWYGKTIIIGNEVTPSRLTRFSAFTKESQSSYELLFYPRDQLDHSALQARMKLPARPLLLDVRADGYLFVLCEDSLMFMYKLTEHYSGSSVSVREMYRLFLPTREAKVQPTRKANGLSSASLPSPGGGISIARIFPPLDHAKCSLSTKQSILPVPSQIMLLRATGSLVLLDSKQMVSIPLLRRVEQFWYTPSVYPPFESIEHRPLWWAYGDDGLHVCFRDGMRQFLGEDTTVRRYDQVSLNGHRSDMRARNDWKGGYGVEQWFELDPEVYPLGLIPKFGMILGATQGLVVQSVSSDGHEVPSHVIKVKRQPVLHTLLRHLLMKPTSDDREALQIALKCTSQPQFIDSLEWLLYEAVLDHDYDMEHLESGDGEVKDKKNEMLQTDDNLEKFLSPTGSGLLHSSIVPMSPGRVGSSLGLFPRVVRLLKYFGEYEDIVVRCARKMDSKRWPLLFSLAGEPTALLEQCFVSGRLRTAACLLVILQEMWGFISSTPHSLRLLDAALERGELSLAADLSKFLGKADQAGVLNSSQMRIDEDVSWIADADRVPRSGLDAYPNNISSGSRRIPAVDLMILKHSRRLLGRLELRRLAALSARMDFPLAECIRRESGGKKRSRPLIRDFGGILLSLHRQFQWPEPQPSDVSRAVKRYEDGLAPAKEDNIAERKQTSQSILPKNTPSRATDEGTLAIESNKVFGSTLPPPPSSYENEDLEGIRVKARRLCRQELMYLLRVSTAAEAPDLSVCIATLLLRIDVLVNIFRCHEDLLEIYLSALKQFNVAGYSALADFVVRTVLPEQLSETFLVAPIEDVTL